MDHFSYIGSIINTDGTDERDVDSRIKKAGIAFGSLRKSLFSSPNVHSEVNGVVYKMLILPILLYGADFWCLTEHLLRKLRNFHHQCVRAMCRVNRLRTRQLSISNAELLERPYLKPIDTYICRQQLRCSGQGT